MGRPREDPDPIQPMVPVQYQRAGSRSKRSFLVSSMTSRRIGLAKALRGNPSTRNQRSGILQRAISPAQCCDRRRPRVSGVELSLAMTNAATIWPAVHRGGTARPHPPLPRVGEAEPRPWLDKCWRHHEGSSGFDGHEGGASIRLTARPVSDAKEATMECASGRFGPSLDQARRDRRRPRGHPNAADTKFLDRARRHGFPLSSKWRPRREGWGVRTRPSGPPPRCSIRSRYKATPSPHSPRRDQIQTVPGRCRMA